MVRNSDYGGGNSRLNEILSSGGNDAATNRPDPKNSSLEHYTAALTPQMAKATYEKDGNHHHHRVMSNDSINNMRIMTDS